MAAVGRIVGLELREISQVPGHPRIAVMPRDCRTKFMSSQFAQKSPSLRVVCAVLQHPDGRILAALRPPGRSLANKWEFPGGKIEPDESPSEAIVREISEEMGVIIRPTKELTSVWHVYPDFEIELVPFLCEIISGELTAREHAALRWVNRSEASDLDWAAADIPILEEIPWPEP